MSAKHTVRRFRAASEIFSQGEIRQDYFIVRSGWIVLTKLLEDGSRHNIDFALPGDTLGTQGDLGAISPYSAECVTDAEICVIAGKKIAGARDLPFGMVASLLAASTIHQNRAYEHQTNLARRDARSRLANLLTELFVRVCGRLPLGPADQAEIPLTQTHLGDALGLTNIHVNRVLRSLRDDGVLRFVGGLLEVLDPEALLMIAGYDAPRPQSFRPFDELVPSGRGLGLPGKQMPAPARAGFLHHGQFQDHI
jgi:CRP-like cAMP-binding protein